MMDALFLTSSGLKLSELDASVDEERLQVKPFSCKEGERMIQRGLHAWGILIGPFAASWAHFVQAKFILFNLHTGEPILITPEGQ